MAQILMLKAVKTPNIDKTGETGKTTCFRTNETVVWCQLLNAFPEYFVLECCRCRPTNTEYSTTFVNISAIDAEHD